jgi:hypothetical protein
MYGLIINLILSKCGAGGLALQAVWLVDDPQVSVGQRNRCAVAATVASPI